LGNLIELKFFNFRIGEKMIEMGKSRYATQQIASNVSQEIQELLWKLIDIRSDRREPLDHLQVFHLQRNGDIQIITNKQEQPPMVKLVTLRLRESKPLEITI
jgi:hypothetical protein